MLLDDCLTDLIGRTAAALSCTHQDALREVLAMLREVADSEGLDFDRANRWAKADHRESLLATKFRLTP